jgi:hypothetical protein
MILLKFICKEKEKLSIQYPKFIIFFFLRKIKAKEDEQQLKLLKEQYLDFDGDDDGRRIKISKGKKKKKPHLQKKNSLRFFLVPMDDDEEEDDPDYNSEAEEDEEDDDDDEDNPMNLKDRMSELERQRSIQDTQVK